MSFKINDTEIVINGKSIIKTLIVIYLAKKVYNVMRKPKAEYYVVIDTESKNTQKVTKAKQKVESK